MLKEESIITTRYRGSKTKIIPAIWNSVKNLEFDSILDCFGGTGAVSYFFKKQNKTVTYNDHLNFNYIIGRALIENSLEHLDSSDINFILQDKDYNSYPHLIEKNFHDIYYTDEENRWLDRVISNINALNSGSHGYKRDMALWCLFQSCIIKRPFSLFHRKNLNVRMREVKRSFGNKVTWETPFEDHYKKFAEELNSYVYNSNKKCIAIKKDVLDIDSNNNYDLVYIDPPYIPARGENIIYRDLYHFLEGITIYNSWESLIDNNSKHKRLIPEYNPWNDKKAVFDVFEKLIGKFKDSIILISHRSEGLPSINELIKILKKYKKEVECVDIIYHKYALSTKKSEEVLLMGI